MHRAGKLTRKFEAWNRQLQVRIGKVHDGIEQRHRHRLNAHLFQRPIEAIRHGLIDQPVMLLIDRRILVALRLRGGRRQADKMRRAVVAAPVGSAWNFAPMPSMRSRRTLPDRKPTSWPSAIRMCPIASSGLRWPVAGVEARRIFMGPVPLVVERCRAVRDVVRSTDWTRDKLKTCSYASISRRRKMVTAAMRDGLNKGPL